MENNNDKSEVELREEKILEFWRENKIFEKSMKEREGKKEFIFYEGPPTANGKPGIHHVEARAFKDAIPRYKTMRGYHVRRKGGWDTHGLPVELQVEKKLGLNSKKAIEEYGIEKFNKECKESVWEYLDIWNKFTKRMGYWVDQDNPYVTYDNNYIESVWNVVKKVSGQDLLYKDYRVVPWCTRCGTALSSHELAQGYEDVKDLSIYAKFIITSSGDEVNKYFLAWTTTPWTLPGNIALAAGKDITYVEAKVAKENGSEFLILAKERIALITEPYEIVAEHKGSELVGMEYEPLFPYLKAIIEKKGESTEKAFKVYAADFVNTEDGTGMVHTAVMYGQDDFVLGTKVGLPKVHLVNPEGRFIEGTGFLEGRYVKEVNEEGKPTLAVDIIEELKKQNLFFNKENYQHSYPHCWRCHTALIYYARDSWYIRMSDKGIKEKMIAENKEINWEPAHTRDGRFGEWLKEIKDWAISRERYWGTPLPVWDCEKCQKREVIGGLEELKKKTKKSNNKYFVMRHGEAENNAKNIYSSNRNINHLTEKGRGQVMETAQILKVKKITKIYCSPFLRTRETAELVAEQIGFPKEKIVFDERIRELEFGDFSERPVQEYWDFMKGKTWEIDTRVPGGESFQDGKNRLGDFLYDIDPQNKDETILIVSHGLAVEMVPAVIEVADAKRSLEVFHHHMNNKTAALHREHEFVALPHNENYELDLHRPYIDAVALECDCGGKLVRTKEVMDVWFDSGAMPFAQDHYPFENKKWVDGAGYPADFISEAIDQTRGWFYTLHAVGVLMGRGKAFKNVICLGHLLDAKGKKMSKSLGNVVDPWVMMSQYGVDTLRLWMYSVNQPGESKNFDEKTVLELNRQVFGLLYNVLAFYKLYRDKKLEINTRPTSKNLLDIWILAKFDELVDLSTKNLDNYKLLEPTRAIRDFIGDLSTWYLRRSRERIKNGDAGAKQTLYYVLKNLAKVMAPLAPFTAEDIWQTLRGDKDVESVHLAKWPTRNLIKRISFVLRKGKMQKIVLDMNTAREVVSRGLEARQKLRIQVRQPLMSISTKILFPDGLRQIIKEELNVKEVVQDPKLEDGVVFDTKIDEELKAEGDYRELVRALQDIRKKIGLTPNEEVTLKIETNERGQKLVEKFAADLKKTVLVSQTDFVANDGEEVRAGELFFKVKIEKQNV